MAKECQKILQRRIKDFNSKDYIFSPQESTQEFLVKKAASRQTPWEWETVQEQIDIRCVEDITHAWQPTDELRLRVAGIPVYGTSGLFVDIDDDREHGRDERVGVKELYESQEFLYRLVKILSSGK